MHTELGIELCVELIRLRRTLSRRYSSQGPNTFVWQLEQNLLLDARVLDKNEKKHTTINRRRS